MIKEVSKKKFILIGVSALLALALIFLGVWFFFFRERENNQNKIFYYPADYEENIFENKAYVGFQRGLTYCAIGVEQLFIYEENYDDASVECEFFLDYFNAVIHGEYEKIKGFYTDDYFDVDPKFTMQMIYEPYVRFHSQSDELIDGKSETLYNFHVSYKIFKNNGTFRRGVSSNQSIPQIYQLIKTEDGSYKIYRILEVEFKDE